MDAHQDLTATFSRWLDQTDPAAFATTTDGHTTADTVARGVNPLLALETAIRPLGDPVLTRHSDELRRLAARALTSRDRGDIPAMANRLHDIVAHAANLADPRSITVVICAAQLNTHLTTRTAPAT